MLKTRVEFLIIVVKAHKSQKCKPRIIPFALDVFVLGEVYFARDANNSIFIGYKVLIGNKGGGKGTIGHQIKKRINSLDPKFEITDILQLMIKIDHSLSP